MLTLYSILIVSTVPFSCFQSKMITDHLHAYQRHGAMLKTSADEFGTFPILKENSVLRSRFMFIQVLMMRFFSPTLRE